MSEEVKKEEVKEEEKEYEKVYCSGCGKCLFEEAIFMGKVRIKCYNCNTIIVFERNIEITEEPQLKVKRPKKKKS